MHAQGPVDAGAVDAEEDPVGDAGPARVLGTAVEARLKRRQRNGRAEAAAAALPLLHPPPQPGGPVSRCPAALPRSPPTRPPHRRSAARSPAAPSPSPARGRSEAAPLGKAGGRPAPPGYLIRRRCPEPLEESLNLRLARLRRHVLSFPDTTAATGAGRAQSAQGVGPQYGCRLSPHRAADGPPRGSAPTCPVAMTTGGGGGGTARRRSAINRSNRHGCSPGRGSGAAPAPRVGVSGEGPSSAPCASPAITPSAAPACRPRRFSSFTASSPANRFLSLNANRGRSRDPRQLWLVTVCPQPLRDAGMQREGAGPDRGRLCRMAGRPYLPWYRTSCSLRRSSGGCLQASPAAASGPQATRPWYTS